jgi:tripartite-type tricarboxylate transporter receptor subunit TctC
MAVTPTTLIVSPAKGWKTVNDMVAAAKAKPGGLVATSAGIGSSTHMNLERFRIASGIEVLHVPMKGSPEAITEVLTGRADMSFALTFQAAPFVRDGKLLALAMGSPKRSALMPDVPTLSESGFPGMDLAVWNGLMAPAKTPKEVVAKLNAEIRKAMGSADIKAKLQSQGFGVASGTPEQFGALLKSEIERWSAVVKASGAKID